jgi:hypothetical protein
MPGVDYQETFAPTPRFSSIRIILALIAEFDLDARQIDVKGAFLQATLTETIYMRQPEGFVDPDFPEKVFLLLKSLYGLRQAGNEWWKLLRSELSKLGFTPLNADVTIYIKIINSQVVLICFHVDDGLVAASKGWMHIVIGILLKTPFTITDLGEPSLLLGCLIERDRDAGIVKLSQPSYISELVSRFSLSDGKPYESPMAGDLLPEFNDAKDEEVDKKLYLEYIGSLNWCSVASRPDISFAVSHLASFSSRPSKRHLTAARRVILYLKGTCTHGITYKRGDPLLRGFADADYANDKRDGKSISGWCFSFAGGLISWSAQKQRRVARSTMESEYYAAAAACQEAVWLRRLFTEISTALPVPTGAISLSIDNTAAISFIRQDLPHKRTKHIDNQNHYVRNCEELGDVTVSHISGTVNPADIFTKPLPTRLHLHALELLRLHA